jgi:hypothetical protein
LLHQAAPDGTPLHEVERALWQPVLRLVNQALQHSFTLKGS